MIIRNADPSPFAFHSVEIGGRKIPAQAYLNSGEQVLLERTVHDSAALLMTLRKLGSGEELDCELDNRRRPCVFEVVYRNGRLGCSSCDRF